MLAQFNSGQTRAGGALLSSGLITTTNSTRGSIWMETLHHSDARLCSSGTDNP